MFRQIMTAVVVAFIGVACARSQGPKVGEVGLARPDSIVVNVLNENYYDARIHALYDGGQRRTLGTIAGNGGKASIALPWEPRALVFGIMFVTEGSTYVSLPVDVAAGEAVEVRVPQNISASGFFRRVGR